jgi:phosphate transport system substrate-binding protein
LRFGAPLVLAVTVAGACSSSSSSTTSSNSTAGGSATSASGPAVSGTLNGSGSSFQQAFDAAAIDGFTKANKGTAVNYNPSGSGQGQTDLEGQLVDFAGSDVTVLAADVPKFKGGTILYFPTVAGPITVSYNLSGVSKLQFSASTLAKIFSRTVKTWNNPSIAADNPGVTLPSTAITVAHRSDGSGTTANFTEFLKVAGGSDWTYGSSKTWPTDSKLAAEQAGKGNPGVDQIVKGTAGAIGYVDYSDAKASGLVFASIKNAAGKFVDPSLDAASAAVAGATVNADLTYDPINAPGDTAYPITSPTYIIAYAKQTDAGKTALLKAFLKYVLGPDGQGLASGIDFAKLPSDLDAKVLAQVDTIAVG